METVSSLIQSWSADIVKLRKRLVDAGVIQPPTDTNADDQHPPPPPPTALDHTPHTAASSHAPSLGHTTRLGSQKSIGRAESLQRAGSTVSALFRVAAPAPYEEDDLHLARYLKSFRGDIDRCVNALKRAKIWRIRNRKYVEECRRAAERMESNCMPILPSRLSEYGNIVLSYLPSAPHFNTRSGEPIVIVRFGVSNMRALCEVIPLPVFRDFMVFSNEWEFWQCDFLSRHTGKVHRCYRMIDLAEVAVKNIDKRLMGVISESSKLSDVLHPQMTARTVFCNTPSVLKVAFTAFKKFGFSARAAAKFHVVKKSSQGAAADDVVKSLADATRLPSFLGGTCRCANGCIPGLSNDLTKTIPADVDQLKKDVVLIEAKYVQVQRSFDSICENYGNKFHQAIAGKHDPRAHKEAVGETYTTSALSTTSDYGEAEGGGSDDPDFLSEVVLSAEEEDSDVSQTPVAAFALQSGALAITVSNTGATEGDAGALAGGDAGATEGDAGALAGVDAGATEGDAGALAGGAAGTTGVDAGALAGDAAGAVAGATGSCDLDHFQDSHWSDHGATSKQMGDEQPMLHSNDVYHDSVEV